MSQVNVERVIGRLVTDEALRRRFTTDPRATLQDLVNRGVELNPSEVQALLDTDPRILSLCASAIDPRLQKTDLQGGAR
jgi:hypothetical protein